MYMKPPLPSRTNTITVANSVVPPFTWESVPMQTLSLLPNAYSRAMVVDTSSRMGWRKGSPLNFFQVIKLVLMNSTEKNATEREFKVKILLFRPISQIARITQSRHNIRLAGEFAVYVANPQVGIR